MEREERTDRFTALEDRFADYEVYDPNGEKIGKVDDLFVDENDKPRVHRGEDGLPRDQVHPDPLGNSQR